MPAIQMSRTDPKGLERTLTLGRIIAKYQHGPALHLLSGIASLEGGCFEAAVVSLDRAVAIKSNYALAWTSRGDALVSLGRVAEAIGSFDRAIKIDPHDFAVL
jgi:Flp pilus assembly protein TadD